MKKSLEKVLTQIFLDQTLITAIFSSPRKNNTIPKVSIRPLMIKEELQYQITEMRDNKAIHTNVKGSECQKKMEEFCELFGQAFFYTAKADFHLLISKKGHQTILEKPPSKAALPLAHNRAKEYLIEEGETVPFLVELGIMSTQGKVYPKKQDKFRQINRFLEFVNDVLPHLPKDKPLSIIDFGCGKAYLTFAVYYYLKIKKGYDVTMIGVDLKSDVIETCSQLAQKLGYSHLSFCLGNIGQYYHASPVDMVIALHACDTATDAALEKALEWQAKVILSVPCCQHELLGQIHNEELSPLLKHGILKERFSALVTDAARAQILDILGYNTQVLEFIDMEHTAKNLLIRAVKRDHPSNPQKALEAYQTLKQCLHITPSLEKSLRLTR